MNEKEQIEGFKPTFENGGFWEYYRDLEHQFENFLEYVPYLPGNEKTYSFRLLSLVLSIGGHIDSAFKEMARFPRFSEKDTCKTILERATQKQGIFDSGVNAFNQIYSISRKKVIFKCIPNRKYVTPFSASSKWWEIYNTLKHEFSFDIGQANLANTLDALAGAFLLNARHIPAALRLFDYGLVNFPVAQLGRVDFEKLLEAEERYGIPAFLETPLFRYDYVE